MGVGNISCEKERNRQPVHVLSPLFSIERQVGLRRPKGSGRETDYPPLPADRRQLHDHKRAVELSFLVPLFAALRGALSACDNLFRQRHSHSGRDLGAASIICGAALCHPRRAPIPLCNCAQKQKVWPFRAPWICGKQPAPVHPGSGVPCQGRPSRPLLSPYDNGGPQDCCNRSPVVNGGDPVKGVPPQCRAELVSEDVCDPDIVGAPCSVPCPLPPHPLASWSAQGSRGHCFPLPEHVCAGRFEEQGEHLATTPADDAYCGAGPGIEMRLRDPV